MKSLQIIRQVRQGDVLLIEVAAIPAGAKDVTPHGPIILAYGEVTGHKHQIVQTLERPVARVWDAGAERYIRVLEAAPLIHEEHGTVTLPPGTVWRQVHQVEERGEEVRRVAD